MVEKQYQTSVKGVRSDNAPELKFTDLYRAKGIQAFHSCPETPYPLAAHLSYNQLSDYYCNVTETDIPYPLAAHLSYNQLSEGYRSYICSISLHPEPASFVQAKKFEEWIKEMNEELIALEGNNTWDICPLPPDKHAIG